MMRLHVEDPLRRAESYLLTWPRATHAYALGYLDEAYRGHTQAITWPPEDDAVRALALSYHGLARPALFLIGDAPGVEALLASAHYTLPTTATLHVHPCLETTIERSYRPLDQLHAMHRMVLDRADFTDPGDDPIVERLTTRDTSAVLDLYAHWPDHLFEPWHLRSGLYMGIRTESGELAAIAGTHNVSAQYDIAAIGNLVTHPDHRQKGFARRCNAQLLRAVFQSVNLVTLDVRQGNLAAVRTYEHFGFAHQADYLQGAVARI